MPVTTLDELVGGDPPALIKIDVEGSELLVMKGARRLLTDAATAPVLLFEHAGYCAHFGITPAEVREFLAEVGYSIYLLDGELSPWHSDDLPPTLNVVACRDVAAVRARLQSPAVRRRCRRCGWTSSTADDLLDDVTARRPRRPGPATTSLTPGTKARATVTSTHHASTE